MLKYTLILKHTCNFGTLPSSGAPVIPALWEVEVGGWRVWSQLGYIARPCLKKQKGDSNSRVPALQVQKPKKQKQKQKPHTK
jgi:hypothetical protein